MLYRNIARVLGLYLFVLAGIIGIPFLIACYYDYWISVPEKTAFYFLESMAGCLLLAAALTIFGRRSRGQLYRREGLAIVVLIWFLTPAIGALPFIFSGAIQNPLIAYFEMASGFTTTGATALQAKKYDPQTGEEIPIRKTICGLHSKEYVFYGTVAPVRNQETGAVIREGIEAVPKALLFWRSFTQFLGGGGIVVLFVAILPALGVGGKVLFQTEVTGPTKEGIMPRIKESAFQLWKIYIVLSVLQFILLLYANPDISAFEAITISFSTLSTGGFSVRNDSLESYHSLPTDAIIILFMILGSINFTLYFNMVRGKFYRIYEPEFLLFLAGLLGCCILGAWFLVGTDKVSVAHGHQGIFSWPEALFYGTFQIISAQTSTGFFNTNYDIWPFPTLALMVIVMFIGGMSGSTAGGIKVIRYMMLFRIAQYKIESFFRPEAVRHFRIGEREVDSGAATTVLCFFLIAVVASVLGIFLYIADGCDPETALGLVACMINNTGMAFRMAGPQDSYAFLSDFGLILSSFLMLLGRLEFFAVLVLLIPSFWKQNF